MDLLTHLFLPLTVAFVLWQELFDHPATLALAGFGLLSDFDKFLGWPGLLHSLVTVVPICVAVLAIERWYRGTWHYAPVISGFIVSHLALDFIDGGPIPLLAPLVDGGVGLQYPAQTVFGKGLVGLSVKGPLVSLRTTTPRPGFNTYGFLTGEGIAWVLVFLLIFVVLNRRKRASGATRVSTDGGEDS